MNTMKWFMRAALMLALTLPTLGCEDKPSMVVEDGDEDAIAKYEAMLAAEGEGDTDLDAP